MKEKRGEAAFRDYLGGRGLKSTRQRDAIVHEFVKMRRHITAEDLHRAVARRNPAIGLVTVYRTLKLLAEAGLAQERRFGRDESCYEPVFDVAHHDHMICSACGKITEFENPAIEDLQDRVAKEHGFMIQDHKLELYGVCRECRKPKRGARKRA